MFLEHSGTQPCLGICYIGRLALDSTLPSIRIYIQLLTADIALEKNATEVVSEVTKVALPAVSIV